MRIINRKLLASNHMSTHIPLPVVWYDFRSSRMKGKNIISIIRYRTPELARWSPFDRLSSLRDLLDSAFQLELHTPTSTGWAPVLDVFEDDSKITVHVEPAGMKKETSTFRFRMAGLPFPASANPRAKAGVRASAASDHLAPLAVALPCLRR